MERGPTRRVELWRRRGGTLPLADRGSRRRRRLLLGQTVTDGNGNYIFNGLLPGNYYLVFHAPAGFTFTTQNAGSDDYDRQRRNRQRRHGVVHAYCGRREEQRRCRTDRPTVLYDLAFRAGAADDDVGQSVATDAAGNVYVTGSFHDTVDFDPGPGVYNLTSAGGSDVFVAKYTPSRRSCGPATWAARATTLATGIALNPDGAFYVAGRFSGTASFRPAQRRQSLRPAGGKDVFVAKLDSSGKFLWARGMGGNRRRRCQRYCPGARRQHLHHRLLPGHGRLRSRQGRPISTAVGPKDVFVSKLDSNGNFVWADRMGGTGWSQGMSIGMGIAVADGNGNVYTTGSFQGTADFGLGTGGSILVCAGDTDVFVSKLDSAGNFVWAAAWAAPAPTTAPASPWPPTAPSTPPAVSSDSPTSTPAREPTLSIAPAITASSSPSWIPRGNFVWARGVGGTGWDLATGIALASDGSVYTTGGFWGTADFDPGTGTVSRTSAGEKDAFLLKLNSSGNYVMVQTMGGVKDDAGNGVALHQAETSIPRATSNPFPARLPEPTLSPVRAGWICS